ncbi:MAG: hypothetical protein IPJ89_04480 [Candidatus Iainarchaeum archaeon]|uniref:Uncharacterized protein n=1 Tax=Candidatus Iainarchaeum sp. TaxID=3101447 RepID=A0A7T9DJF4_9ARCH|nr:MAG: hypothetical protein IPJ89_04480 [Candidatus Diapherotrites archaeon]
MHVFAKLGLIVVLAVAFAGMAMAFPFTAEALGPQTIALEKGHSLSVPIKITNLDVDAHDVKISIDTNSNLIKGNSLVKEIELATDQSAEFGIAITANSDASNDSYSLDVRVEADGQLSIIPYTVYVGTNPFLNIVTFNEDVCANDYAHNVSFSVRNSLTTSVLVEASAEQSYLSPSVEPEEMVIGRGETEFFSMIIHTAPLSAGDYDGVVLVKTAQIWAQKAFSVEVNDCAAPAKKPIEMTLPTNQRSLVKFKTTFVPVQIRNLSDETQTITLATNSGIPSENKTIQIPKGENATVQIPFTPDASVPAGTYTVEFIASTETYSQSKLFNVKVIAADHFELLANIPAFTAQKGRTTTVTFQLHNDGDTTQLVQLGMQSATPGVDYTFSPSSVNLGAGQRVTVELKIVPATNTTTNNVQNSIVAVGKETVTYPISFTIAPAPIEDETFVLEFLSAPELVSIAQGETREIQVIVHNPTDAALQEIGFRVSGEAKQAGIAVVSDELLILAPYETRTITLTLQASRDADVGKAAAVLLADGSNAAGSTSFQVDIVSGNPFSGVFTGFVSFIGNTGLGLIVLVFVVLLALGYAYRTPTQDQTWKDAHKSE